MDKKELNIFGRYLYKGYFEEDLDIPIEVNNRLKRTHAWFVSDDDPYIEVSKHLIQQNICNNIDILLNQMFGYLYIWIVI